MGPGNHPASVNSKYLPDSLLVWCIADDERMGVAKSKGTRRRNLWSLFQLLGSLVIKCAKLSSLCQRWWRAGWELWTKVLGYLTFEAWCCVITLGIKLNKSLSWRAGWGLRTRVLVFQTWSTAQRNGIDTFLSRIQELLSVKGWSVGEWAVYQ